VSREYSNIYELKPYAEHMIPYTERLGSVSSAQA